MLYELNDAFDQAAQDDEVKAIVLDANGPHFSSGHDLADQTSMEEFQPVSNWGGFGKAGAEGYQSQEEKSISACAGVGATCQSPPLPRCMAR